MGSLSWLRVATKAVGLSPQPEYPNLEALLEAEEGQPHNDWRLAAQIAPVTLGLCAAASAVGSIAIGRPIILIAAGGLAALAAASWFIFDRLDKSISPSLARLRKLSHEIWEKYRRFSSLVGVEPAISPAVGKILDEAAAIYLKHAAIDKSRRGQFSDLQLKAAHALEEGMARLLDLATPQTIDAQNLELAAGWAIPLFQEICELDRALDQHQQNALSAKITSGSDPLANLREARMELQGMDTAMDELEQQR